MPHDRGRVAERTTDRPEPIGPVRGTWGAKCGCVPRALHGISLLVLLACAGCGSCGSSENAEEPEDFHLRSAIPTDEAAFGVALYQTVGAPLVPGNAVRIVNDGDVFDAMVEEIAGAMKSLHILLYIWSPGRASDRVTAAIAERMKAGPLECRILVDTFGSRGFADEVMPKLTEVGCDVHMYRSDVLDTLLVRNHRKVVVVDGRRGILGGFGVRDDWLGGGREKGEWRDTNVHVEGPVVRGFQRAFAESWIETTGELLPTETFPSIAAAGKTKAAVVLSSDEAVTNAERLMQLLIKAAKKRLWISNAYFVPSDAIMDLLEERAAAGVDVRLLTAGAKSDSKFAFASQQLDLPNLAAKGVRSWEYQNTMMHSKSMVVDDTISMIGSINLEPLSLDKLEEVALVSYDPALNRALAEDFEEDLKYAEEAVDD